MLATKRRCRGVVVPFGQMPAAALIRQLSAAEPIWRTPAPQPSGRGGGAPVAAGFVNGDTPASLLQSPVCSIARRPLTVGRHLIWCEGGGSPDYTIGYPRTATLAVLRHPCAAGTSCATDPPPTPSQRRADKGLQLICHPAIPESNLIFLRGVREVRHGVRKTTWRRRIT